jgi:hypothetical protein
VFSGLSLPVLLLGVLLASGCTTTTERGFWGSDVGWPDGQRLRQSAVGAFRDPQTWVPLAGAAVIGIGGWDDDISEWAVEKAPLFGNDAAEVSDRLRTFNAGAWLATAILAPSDSLESRSRGLLVQGAAVTIEHYSVKGLKSLTGRERPNGEDDESMPSGHTSRASVGAALAAANLDYMAMPDWSRTTLRIGLYGSAAATGWARVEAEKHYPTDVLVGYAIGQFIARFMQGAFFSAEASAMLSFEPMPGGGRVTVVLPLP